MSEYEFIESVSYETEITAASPFPEWIETDQLRLERLDESVFSPQQLRAARARNDGYDRYFTFNRQLRARYDSVLDWYDDADDGWEAHTDACYVMFRADTDVFVGMAYLENVDLGLESAELGVWIDEPHRGSELASHRAEALLVVAFEQLQLDVVHIEVIPANQPSVNSVDKYVTAFGGRFDGRKRNGTHTPADGVKDVYQWSVSHAEFTDETAQYDASPPPLEDDTHSRQSTTPQ